MLAARLVGPSGSVVAMDRSDAALAIAAARAAAAGLTWATFVNQDINAIPPDAMFDAVVGRFVLLHFTDPVGVLRILTRHVKPDGVLAFAEMDIRSTSVTPPFPLLETCLGWIVSLYEKSNLEPDMGSKLYKTYRGAGLVPNLKAACQIQAGSEPRGLVYLVETLRTMRPALIALGIASEAELDVEELTARLASEAARGDHCVIFPRLVGAWATP